MDTGFPQRDCPPLDEDTAAAAVLPTFCPIAATLDCCTNAGRSTRPTRCCWAKNAFNEIGHALGGVNPRTLRERLRGLEAEGIVERRVLRDIPPWVEYELTEKGRALEAVMNAMATWAKAWVIEPKRARTAETTVPSKTKRPRRRLAFGAVSALRRAGC
jgi:DNA-binding HxlR family transcriptional regulator